METRKLLMIPGPIECEANVLQAMGAPVPGHTAPGFIASFGRCLSMMKHIWQSPTGQPFIIAGTGTLAMEMAAANLVEKEDEVLVLSTGYFGERYARILECHGARVTLLKAPTGQAIEGIRVEEALQSGNFKLMTFTHVDTSTAVRVDAQAMGRLGQKYGVLTILDGVCSVGGEEIRQEEWGLDVVLTASQKAIGVPPGLALLVVSQKAMETWGERTTPPSGYYTDWANWLPIMQAYEKGQPAYFGTPATNLVVALEKGLDNILREGLEDRFKRHKYLGNAFRAAMMALGLTTIPASENLAANTLSAPYLPEGVALSDFMQAMGKTKVAIAGGLLPEIKTKYFRVGHMGATGTEELKICVESIAQALHDCGLKANGEKAWNEALEHLRQA